MIHLRFLLLFFLFTTGFLSGYYFLFKHQLGAVLVSGSWINEVYKYKENNLDSSRNSDQRILIFSGSNSLFGINSLDLQSYTDMPVHNFSTHAGLDLDFHYYKMRDIVRKNDIVVMPLEFQYYSRDGYTEWFTNNVMVWEPEFFYSLQILEKIEFIKSVDKMRVVTGLVSAGKRFEEASVEQLDRLPRRGKSVYTYKNLVDNNDILIDKPPTEKVKGFSINGISYLPPGSTISYSVIAKLNKIKSLIDERGATLFLTWPTTLRNPQFTASNQNVMSRISSFQSDIANSGFDIQCPWHLFNYDVNFFFDTRYHLNKSGTDIRTFHLSECLNFFLRGRTWPLSDEETQQFVLDTEKQLQNLDELSVRIDFKRVNMALAKDHGG